MPAQTVIQVRRSTESQWVTANPVLAVGEPGLETDTGKFKWGNGVDEWVDLSYASGAGGAVISETPPVDAELGSLWFDSSEGRTYIYYDETFVELTPAIKGADGANGIDGSNAFHPFLIG